MKKNCYKLHTKDEFALFQSNIEKITHQMEPHTTTCERGKAPPFSTLADRFSIFFYIDFVFDNDFFGQSTHFDFKKGLLRSKFLTLKLRNFSKIANFEERTNLRSKNLTSS